MVSVIIIIYILLGITFGELTFLPDCTKTNVILGEVIQEELESRKISIGTNVRLNLGLTETACLYVQTENQFPRLSLVNSSLWDGNSSDHSSSLSSTPSSIPYNNATVLYVIRYIGLNQLHPVRQRYQFAIPYLESKCICDCSGGADHCPVGYQYKNCSGQNDDGICVTTYSAHQPATGCLQGQESELCCELSARPYQNTLYTALYIGQPDAVAEFQYQLYTAAPDGTGWTKSTDQTFRVSLNRHQKLELAHDRLEIRVSGIKPFYQLKDGMYFYENQISSTKVDLRDGVPLNELGEYDLGRLGWFRRRNGKWTIRNGWIRLQDAHKVQVKNCKEQTYTETFNAEYYVTSSLTDDNDGIGEQGLGREVADEEPWIRDTFIETGNADQKFGHADFGSLIGNSQRLIVTHKDSNPIEIDLTIDSKIKLVKMMFQSSTLTDFSGSIQIDRFSNRYLNLTVIGARGTLIGTVYRTITRHNADLAFSHYVGSSGTDDTSMHKTTIALPAQVNTSRWICIHPLNRVQNEICKWVSVEISPLDNKETPIGVWTAQRGQCSDCNQITFQNFLHYLNPSQWVNGITSPAEALAMGAEIVFYGVLVLVAIALCRRLACPLVKWAICAGQPICTLTPKKPSSSSSVSA